MISDFCGSPGDFHEISMEEELTLSIPLHLINTPVGVTKGGILQQIRREVTVSGLPGKLAEVLEADVSALDMGDSFFIKDIPVPDGTNIDDDGHLAVAVVSAPAAAPEIEEGEEEEAEAEEAAEGAETETPSESSE